MYQESETVVVGSSHAAGMCEDQDRNPTGVPKI